MREVVVATPVLEVGGLEVAFPGVCAVAEVDLVVRPGETLGLVGESGSGKTSVGLALMGLLPPSARVRGSIRVRGREVLGLSDREWSAVRGRELAMVFQDAQSAFTPVYSIGDQLAEAVRAHADLSRAAARHRAAELLDLVGIPSGRARAFPHELSGGMLQRAMIAMAVTHRPAMLIADEPTSALDVTVQAQILELLATLRDQTGASLLLISHDLGVVAGLADRVAVMHRGQIVESGRTEQVFQRPQAPYTITLLTATPFPDPACTAREALGSTSPGQGASRMGAAGPVGPGMAAGLVGRQRGIPSRERNAVLRVEGLVRRFEGGARTAVDGVSFEVHEGETLALVGESGSGKTTTLREILALKAPQYGRVVVFGRDVSRLSRGERRWMRRDIQMVFQDSVAALDPRMPVAEIVAEPLRAHGVGRSQARRRVGELLELVELSPEHARRFPQELSGGQRQRVAIARALALEPRLVVLDEPVSALDVSVRAAVLRLLSDLQARLDLAYLVVAHDLAMVAQMADRVAVMYRGRIVEIGDVERVYREPVHPYTRALVAAVLVPDPALARARVPLCSGEEELGSAGCGFLARCPLAAALEASERRRCENERPELSGSTAGSVACHHARLGGDR